MQDQADDALEPYNIDLPDLLRHMGRYHFRWISKLQNKWTWSPDGKTTIGVYSKEERKDLDDQYSKVWKPPDEYYVGFPEGKFPDERTESTSAAILPKERRALNLPSPPGLIDFLCGLNPQLPNIGVTSESQELFNKNQSYTRAAVTRCAEKCIECMGKVSQSVKDNNQRQREEYKDTRDTLDQHYNLITDLYQRLGLQLPGAPRDQDDEADDNEDEEEDDEESSDDQDDDDDQGGHDGSKEESAPAQEANAQDDTPPETLLFAPVEASPITPPGPPPAEQVERSSQETAARDAAIKTIPSLQSDTQSAPAEQSADKSDVSAQQAESTVEAKGTKLPRNQEADTEATAVVDQSVLDMRLQPSAQSGSEDYIDNVAERDKREQEQVKKKPKRDSIPTPPAKVTNEELKKKLEAARLEAMRFKPEALPKSVIGQASQDDTHGDVSPARKHGHQPKNHGQQSL